MAVERYEEAWPAGSVKEARAACTGTLRSLLAYREEFHFRWEPRLSAGFANREEACAWR